MGKKWGSTPNIAVKIILMIVSINPLKAVPRVKREITFSETKLMIEKYESCTILELTPTIKHIRILSINPNVSTCANKRPMRSNEIRLIVQMINPIPIIL
jgi:hypothetical protein